MSQEPKESVDTKTKTGSSTMPEKRQKKPKKIVPVKAEKQNTKVNLAFLKSEYEGGILTRAQICEKHGINKSTLYRHAVSGEWEFGRNQDKALTTMQTAMVRRMGERRADIGEQHLMELNELKTEIFAETDPRKYRALNEKTEALIKVIKAERLALALPDSYKYVEQKTETTFKVEDALRELEEIDGDYEEVDDIHLPRETSLSKATESGDNGWQNSGDIGEFEEK